MSSQERRSTPIIPILQKLRQNSNLGYCLKNKTKQNNTKNRKMTPIESILKRGIGRMEENDGGVNLTKIHSKHFCKCHKAPPIQQYANKNKM
jgi:hypothetical protein